MRSGRKLGCNWSCSYFLFEKKIVKRFVQCHIFAQSPLGRDRSDKYPVNTSHLSRFVSAYFIRRVAAVVHIQSLCRWVCTYIHILFTM